MALPTAIYTMFGGVQAVTWTDVKQMFLIVFGLVAAAIALVIGLARQRRRRRGAAHSPARPAGCRCSTSRTDLTISYTFWSGTIGALFLFLSYFGTDQSQVQRYLTAKSVDEARVVAVHERLLEDSAAGAGADHRRVHVRVLPLHAAADAVQPRARSARARERAGGRVRRRSSSSLARRSRPQAAAEQFAVAQRSGDAAAAGCQHRGVRAPGAARHGRARRGGGARQGGLGRLDLQRRQLRLSDLHRDAPAGRSRRPDDGGDLRRGDVDHLRRSWRRCRRRR